MTLTYPLVVKKTGKRPIATPTPKLERDPFWHGKSIDVLATEQGVKPLRSLEDLRGDWPEEDSIDEFLAELRRWRR